MTSEPIGAPLDHLLTEEQIALLTPYGKERRLEVGELLFDETATVDSFYVVLEGEVRISRLEGAEEYELGTHLPGEFTGGLAVLTGRRSVHRARATAPTRVLEITSDTFHRMAAEVPEVADVLVSRLASRMRETQRALRQQEKMAALGKLSAGLAHELNNPASAARRAAASLRFRVLEAQEVALRNDARFTSEEKEGILALERSVAKNEGDKVPPDPLERSDREEELAGWLEERGVEEAWELGPVLADAGLDVDRMADFAGGMEGERLAGALGWLGTTLVLAGLAGEVEESTGRISELVGAMKEYSYMDRAPVQEVDVHEGIENTLVILGHKLKKGNVEVVREYDPALPRVPARGGELNQVWTNLIDNAADAISGNGGGSLKIKTSREGGRVTVEITDDGPGIPRELQGRIFEPFFTTKAVGQGTGLGLDIVHRIVRDRHGGDIRLDSKPGETRFSVRLPVEVGQGDGG